jgi:hypothetical protein
MYCGLRFLRVYPREKLVVDGFAVEPLLGIPQKAQIWYGLAWRLHAGSRPGPFCEMAEKEGRMPLSLPLAAGRKSVLSPAPASGSLARFLMMTDIRRAPPVHGSAGIAIAWREYQ